MGWVWCEELSRSRRMLSLKLENLLNAGWLWRELGDVSQSEMAILGKICTCRSEMLYSSLIYTVFKLQLFTSILFAMTCKDIVSSLHYSHTKSKVGLRLNPLIGAGDIQALTFVFCMMLCMLCIWMGDYDQDAL